MAVTSNNQCCDHTDTCEYFNHSSGKDLLEFVRIKDAMYCSKEKKGPFWCVCSLLVILSLLTLSVFGTAAIAAMSYNEVGRLKLQVHNISKLINDLEKKSVNSPTIADVNTFHNDISTLRKELIMDISSTHDGLTDYIDSIRTEVKSSHGVVYTRWGSPSCPLSDTVMLYSGRVGSSHCSSVGGEPTHLCLPPDPDHSQHHSTGMDNVSYVHGSQYKLPLVQTKSLNVPCAVCSVSNRIQSLVIPAKSTCPEGWTREYYGYLMSSLVSSCETVTSFLCVEHDQDFFPGTDGHMTIDGLYYLHVNCSSLPCPPYQPENSLTCVVCTK